MAQFTIDGLRFDVPDAMLTPRISEKLANGSYEADERRAALMRLRPGQRVLELGAGLGVVTASCASVAGAEAVTSVEANPDLIAVIRGNLERNNLGAVELLHGAVSGQGDGVETIAFDTAGAFWAGHITDDAARAPSVREVPRLDLRGLLARTRPAQVVMDVEGAEAEFFDAPWPDHVRRIILELHPKRYPDTTIKRIVDCLSASGLTYDPGPSRGRILCFRRLRSGDTKTGG